MAQSGAQTLPSLGDPGLATLSLAPVVQSSHWDERGPHGGVLLQEQGTLAGWGLRGQYDRKGWRVGLSLSKVSGGRHYDGQTNLGVPVQTDVSAALLRTQLFAVYRHADGWLLGLDWAHRTQRRELRSIPGVASGYTERWVSDEPGLRVGAHWVATGQWVASMTASPWSQTHMTIASESMDEAVLRPRRQQVAQLALSWQAPASGQWVWGLNGQLDWRRTLRSDPVAWMRNGSLRGSLTQPETREVLYGLGLEFSRMW
ncbi:MAG: hypothetical protein KGL57_02800 [Burkholderiales bacterium]|nr:hypothetical protein [Burkholderiales bacterium]